MKNKNAVDALPRPSSGVIQCRHAKIDRWMRRLGERGCGHSLRVQLGKATGLHACQKNLVVERSMSCTEE